MCYDKRFLKSWAKPRVQQRGQIKPGIERARPEVQPNHPAFEREITHRKEVEREFEEIV